MINLIHLRLRERKKLLSQLPDFGLKTVGENASAEIPVTMRTPLLMSDLQTLLMYLMVGDRMPWATTRWCKVGYIIAEMSCRIPTHHITSNCPH